MRRAICDAPHAISGNDRHDGGMLGDDDAGGMLGDNVGAMFGDDDVVRPKDLPSVLGISSVTAWRYRRLGKFPSPVRLTSTTVGWRRRVLRAWLAARPSVDRKSR